MKTRTILQAVAAAVLLSSCSLPGSTASDPMRNAMGFGMQGQMEAHRQASVAYSGAAAISPLRAPRAARMQVPAFPAFQPFAQ